MAACQRIHAQSLLFCLLLPSYLVFRFSPFSETPRLRFKNSLTSGKWVDSLASIKEHGWSGESAKGWMKKLISESTLLFLVEKTGIGMKIVKALDSHSLRASRYQPVDRVQCGYAIREVSGHGPAFSFRSVGTERGRWSTSWAIRYSRSRPAFGVARRKK